MILVSACLVGLSCRYDKKQFFHPELISLVKEGKAVPFCPEQLGGLSTPRPPCEINGGDGFDVLNGNAIVVNTLGEDVTAQFVQGANQSLELCRLIGANGAILKSKSPSCGLKSIYSGQFDSKLRPGCGVTAAKLTQNGIRVFSEEDDYEG